ncbi:MAG TPA: pitrilysin family protein [Gammaproteobacteria bacterium]|nr:pitrilysin family protein [Gammaproteobacteria bacterium]
MRRLLYIALTLLTLSAPAALAVERPEIQEFKLNNGMTVIVRPDHRAPVVASMVWYRIGSSYEEVGSTGISHVLEHMMFKGTTRYPAGEFSRIIALQGGRENAFTGRDFTAYFQQLAADRLPIALELEADRMRNLRLQEADFKKEVQVVMEERRLRTEDNPIALALEHFNTVANLLSPYRNPIVGWMEDLQAMTMADLQRWYQRWYAPNNAILVVAGDVEPEAVRVLAERYFGRIPARALPAVRKPITLQTPGSRRIEVSLPAELPYLTISYETPSMATAAEAWEPYALTVLAGVLDGGESARLSSELVRGREVAAGVGADYSAVARLSSQFSFSGYPARNRTLADLEAALLEQVERVREGGINAEELERAKNQMIADHLYQLDSIFYQAMQIGMLETTGIGWRTLLEFEDRIRAVTAEQVQAVARRYLTEPRRAILHLNPISGGQG